MSGFYVASKSGFYVVASKYLPGFHVWLLSAPVASMSGFYVASRVALSGLWWLRYVASKYLLGFYVWLLCGFLGDFVWLLVAATRGF